MGMSAILPSHLLPLDGGEWAVWRCSGLRGAGFPIEQVLQLAAPQAATAAENLLQVEAEAQRAQRQALTAVNEALDALRRDGQWADVARREPLVQILQTLKKGRVPTTLKEGRVAAAIGILHKATAHLEEVRSQFDQAYLAAAEQTTIALQEICRTDRFREAVVWQNRQAFHDGILPLIQGPAGTTPRRDKKWRQKEELVANYTQRYSVKNDTIGFFGPVGWAQWVDRAVALELRPGPGLIASCEVFFEGWGLDELAQTIAQNPALHVWLCPRRQPYIYLAGETLYRPLAESLLLPTSFAAVLAACDGEHTAKQLAADLLQTPGAQIPSEAEVYRILRQLQARQLISWSLELPLRLHPERTLRQLLQRIEDEPLRQAALAPLDELESALHAVAAATGNAERVEQTLSDLETTFTRLTGAAPTHSHGKVYAARTLVYHDCRRDVEVELGQDLAHLLGPPLALLLTSARWFTFEMAQLAHKVSREVYTELVKQSGSVTVDAIRFGLEMQPRWLGDKSQALEELVTQLQTRWSEILAVPSGPRSVAYASADLRPKVMEAFAAPQAGWSTARYHSPDIMLVADSVEAIRQGAYQIVLGEMHMANHTLSGALWTAQHPTPGEINRLIDLDLPEMLFHYSLPRNWPHLTLRTWRASISPKDYFLTFGHDLSSVPRLQTIPIGELVVEDVAGELRFRTRDGRLQFGVLQFLADMLTYAATTRTAHVSFGGVGHHTPRVTIDRLIVAREAWHFTAAEIEFAYLKEAQLRFLGARRWAQTHQLPRFVFVRVPVEDKPFYLDFDSPIYVNIFAKMVRRVVEAQQTDKLISLTEMLPRPDQVWLTDAEGRRYTSELRLVMLDLIKTDTTS